MDLSQVVIHMGSVDLGIGNFISAIINFVILAFVLFTMVKAVNKMMDATKKQEEEAKKRLESNSLDFGTPPLKRTHLPRTRITLFHPDGASKTNSSNKGIFLAKMPAWRC